MLLAFLARESSTSCLDRKLNKTRNHCPSFLIQRTSPCCTWYSMRASLAIVGASGAVPKSMIVGCKALAHHLGTIPQSPHTLSARFLPFLLDGALSSSKTPMAFSSCHWLACMCRKLKTGKAFSKACMCRKHTIGKAFVSPIWPGLAAISTRPSISTNRHPCAARHAARSAHNQAGRVHKAQGAVPGLARACHLLQPS